MSLSKFSEFLRRGQAAQKSVNDQLADQLHGQMFDGYALAIARDRSRAKLIRIYGSAEPAEKPAAVEIAEVLAARVYITELTPEINGRRAGWRELGLPGDTYRIYCVTQ